MDSREIESISKRIATLWTESLKKRRLLFSRSEHSASSDSRPGQGNHFIESLWHRSQRSLVYDDSEIMELALEYIPLQTLYEHAEKAADENDDTTVDDELVKSMMHWFKTEFFTWVDQPACNYCQGSTTKYGSDTGTKQEKQDGANVVELYKCQKCRKITRFPRYTSIPKLLETRRGRCGEWADCFTLCCRSVGAEARLVLDTTDHVWTEIYSEHHQRWIHCDPCEDAFDTPLVYSEGWNKKLAYCIAFSPKEVVDVTKRYTIKWDETLQRRTLTSEEELAKSISDMCAMRQRNLNNETLAILRERRDMERKELEESIKRTHVSTSEMTGRKSGSLEWRSQRGEFDGVNAESSRIIKPYLNDYKVQTENPEFSTLEFLGAASPLLSDLDTSPNPLAKPIRLTQAIQSQCGGVFLKDTVNLMDPQIKGLEIEFSLRVTNSEGGPAWGGADGLALVIQAQKNVLLGNGDSGMGYDGLVDSLAIEFDTYKNVDRYNDPSDNHISLHGRLPPNPNSASHTHSLGQTSKIPPLNDGQWIDVRARFLTAENMVEVALRKDTPTYNVVLTVNDVQITKYLNNSSNTVIGFTAGTGGLVQNNDISLTRVALYRS
ncbi:hypothetical protein CLU79DRAFT_775013 [Phycomyces nitens]|nr:hypothetical protein CLU79DRAFT_775013 [Phycomyces nitens]